MRGTNGGPDLRRRAGWTRRMVAPAAALVVLPVALANNSQAATEMTLANPGHIVKAGPVNSAHGFPAWYEDSTGRRLEPCLDPLNALCNIPVDDVPNPSAPISMPDNFPAEFFYQLVEAELPLRGGGDAQLTLGLEGAWLNEEVKPGDQTVFARIRVDVDDAVPGTTYRFRHPFGELTVDTDERGRGRFVQDVSPALGNFDTPLAGNLGPFLRWRPNVAPAAPPGYLGDPNVLHQVTGSPIAFNRFTAWQGSFQEGTTDLFSVSGKIATNNGVDVDLAAVNGDHLDVFATSRGTQLQVVGQDGLFETTPMEHDKGTDRHYVRIPLPDGAPLPTSVTVENLGDDPVSTDRYDISGLSVNRATYDGTNLTIAAAAIAPSSFPVEVVGIGTLPSADPVAFPMVAPPAVVTVKDANGATATLQVTVVDGEDSPGGQPVPEPQPEPEPEPEPEPDPDPGDGDTGGNGTGDGETEATVPGAPSITTFAPGDGFVTVGWDPPATDGGSPITSYRVSAVPVGGGTTVGVSVGATATGTTIPGLTNGVTYNVRVRAVNAVGTGEGSVGRQVTPQAI